ncbi:MAG: hypothetical protein EOO71_25505 [Myxococcaceae bacterium]|nr:MAG: hypothetical protein EOO71_25505 [Myxococcaceae bacterium]
MLRGQKLIAVVFVGLLGMGAQVLAQSSPLWETDRFSPQGPQPITGIFLWASDPGKLKGGLRGEVIIESYGVVRNFGYFASHQHVVEVIETLKFGDLVRITPKEANGEDPRLDSITLEKKAAGCACPSASAQETRKEFHAEGRVVAVATAMISLAVEGKADYQRFKVKPDDEAARQALRTLKKNDQVRVIYSVEDDTKFVLQLQKLSTP